MSESHRTIIQAALDAETFDDAKRVADLIAAEVGGRHTRPIGDRHNNFGLMAASGSSYEYKSLEPVTNMQDGVIERLVAAKFGLDESSPYSTPEAAATDLLSQYTYQQRAEMVSVVLRESDEPARSTKRLTIVYRDQGCGMEVAQIPRTIFALGSSHKTDSPWHQGAFGIGGASTYRNAKAVVLVTRRAPEMNPAEDRIAVTVVLWDQYGKGQTASYLTATAWNDGADPSAAPWSASASVFPEFDPGTHLALISYGVEGFHRARSGDERSFDVVLNTRLFVPITPVKFRNDITRGKNEFLRGLRLRLLNNPAPDRLTDEEEMFFTYDGALYKLPVRYWVFPAGEGAQGTRRRFVAKDHALVFTSNGQVHSHWTPTDFRTKTKLNKLYDRVFVVVETDGLPIEMRTALFTPDRAQLLASDAAIQLEDQVADFLNGSHTLSDINSELVRKAISDSSGAKSTIDVARQIATALKIKGFNIGGAGATGGGGGGGGGRGKRKKIETYPDPTTLEGPEQVTIEDGKVRYLSYVLNAHDEFLASGRGALTFECDHPDIQPDKHVAVGTLHEGYVRVQVHVPEGADEGEATFIARLKGWERKAGGIGAEMYWKTKMEIVDELPPRNAGKGDRNKNKGADDGALVALVWRTPEDYGNGWNNSVPGSVDLIAASDLAEAREEYKDLAKFGDQEIPTIVLNETYAPYKAYVSMRAKELTQAGVESASDRYAVGAGLGLLVLYDDERKRLEKGGKPMGPEHELSGKQAVARSVLLMMPSFDTLLREAGIEE